MEGRTNKDKADKHLMDRTRYVMRQVFVHAMQWDGSSDISGIRDWVAAFGDRFEDFFIDEDGILYLKGNCSHSSLVPLDYIVRYPESPVRYQLFSDDKFHDAFRKF